MKQMWWCACARALRSNSPPGRPSEVGVRDLQRGPGEGLPEALGVVDLSIGWLRPSSRER